MTNPEQNTPAAPPTAPARKQRHGCLTALLIVIIVLNALGILGVALLAAGISSGLLGQDITLPTSSIDLSIIVSVLVIVCTVALFMWKKWGFWGLIGLEVINIAFSVSNGNVFSIITSILSAIIAVGLLYGTLQIGGANKGWKQLE